MNAKFDDCFEELKFICVGANREFNQVWRQTQNVFKSLCEFQHKWEISSWNIYCGWHQSVLSSSMFCYSATTISFVELNLFDVSTLHASFECTVPCSMISHHRKGKFWPFDFSRLQASLIIICFVHGDAIFSFNRTCDYMATHNILTD